jgi:seryl-tRNA synthetase
MLDIKLIRQSPDALTRMLKARQVSFDVGQLINLDGEHRQAITQHQDLLAKKNELAGAIGKAVAGGQDATSLKAQAEALKPQESSLENQVRDLGARVGQLLDLLPNWLLPEVPVGQGEQDNQVIHTWGQPALSTQNQDWVKDHVALGEALGGMEFEPARQVAGARFVYLRGQLARLERALAQWMLDTHTQRFGFTEIAPPYVVLPQALYGTGQLPKFKDDLFEVDAGSRYLIPTGEIPLVAWAMGRTFSANQLPLCLTAYTPCFRSEAGSAGRDTRGMIRNHQFHKVELVVLCAQDEAQDWHNRIVGQAQTLLEELDLPYRKVLLCSADTGAGAEITYDLEVWLPSQNTYREIASCSRCGTYQGRRMGAKIKTSEGKTQALCTLNGSGLPTGRTLVALLENGQNPDGSVTLPRVLHPYMGGLDVLRPEPLRPWQPSDVPLSTPNQPTNSGGPQ